MDCRSDDCALTKHLAAEQPHALAEQQPCLLFGPRLLPPQVPLPNLEQRAAILAKMVERHGHDVLQGNDAGGLKAVSAHRKHWPPVAGVQLALLDRRRCACVGGQVVGGAMLGWVQCRPEPCAVIGAGHFTLCHQLSSKQPRFLPRVPCQLSMPGVLQL